MLHFLPAPLLGLLSSTLIVLNTVVWFFLLLPLVLLKVLIRNKKVRIFLSQLMMAWGQSWCTWNSGILHLTQETQWEITGLEKLKIEGSYLILSNHKSWADIFVLQHVFGGHIPFLKFFIKAELIYLPFLGLVWWAMDMPFMKRYSKAYLKKHPEKKGKDMQATRKSCESFKDYPVSVINFVEGTRFTRAKQAKQASPYQHLLRPKAGGTALALSVMGDVLTHVLDVTLCYPDAEDKVFWKLLSGQLPRIIVNIRVLKVPEGFANRDYQNDEEYRERVQNLVNQIWQDKDQRLLTMQGERSDKA